MKKTVFLFLLVLTLAMNARTQSLSANQVRLTSNWQFLRRDIGGIWEAVRSSAAGDPTSVPFWTDVTLPHCFNSEDAVEPDANYYQGSGWYRTALSINNPYPNGRILLHFEGAGQKTQVYVGMQKAGEHVGGYDEWTLDITDFVTTIQKDPGIQKLYNGRVPLSIRCDNSRDLEMIPSNLSDFTVYGGLYRNLNLVYVPETYLSHVNIQAIPDEKLINGRMIVTGVLQNGSKKSAKLNIRVTSSEGKMIVERTVECSGEQFSTEMTVPRIKLWSPDSPVLYSISIRVGSSCGEQIYTDHTAFRSFEFQKQGPFLLNNERLLLRGTHRHEDGAGVGAALTESMIRKEMQMMKDMGVNFIRLGHYQQSRLVLNLCDSLGILVWEEIPWCRGGLGGENYKAQARRMLTNMIGQHYNHPSVIIWGLGNENDWPGDAPEFDKQAIRNFMSELNGLSHQLDPSRKTAIRRCDFCKDIVDVYSPSIWAGWYRGKYTEYMEESLKNMEQVDHFLHVEWGGDSHAGRHSENPDVGLSRIQGGQGADERAGDASLVGGQARVSRDGDWSETYICNLFDWTLKEQEKMPWLTGAAFWIFKDFATPIRPENPVPYVNQKGVVERDLTPKESYYVFQSYWTTKPMVHIYGHSWAIRWGKPGEERMVKVYSNCSEVELFLNGKSMGVKKRNIQDFPATGFHWDVQYTAGENELRAVGKSSGETIVDTIHQKYVITQWSTPEKLELKIVPIDGNSAWIVAQLNDAKGNCCLDAKNKVEFGVTGDARLIENQGTTSGSRKVELCNGVAKIKVMFENPNWVASVKSNGVKTAFCLPDKFVTDINK